ncbi:uncharacterized protein LOC117315403 [Pecten maximus]|uniref:uncharacterized protein LOC117315403 n=1 Tax=Pecten maximus TaxID=6579 RepID=UPI00145862FF|nr:uncharacterized protein LOC117315403 [Pecten maximus]XP_033725474.1 uncharacterized protein LOC117315403 [Pecten maximus]
MAAPYDLGLVVMACWSVLAVMSADPSCVSKGQLYTKLPWYGYLVQKTFHPNNAKIEYQISYPVSEGSANLLIYYDDQVRKLKDEMSCKERENILPAKNNQVIPLNETGRCTVWRDSGEPLYVCVGERVFNSSFPRTWYFAVSKCSMNSSQSLNMNYYFNVTGYYGACEVDPLSKTVIPARVEVEPDVSVIVALGVVCGVTTIVAIVFMILFFLGRRRRKNKKGGSVTSSQATMTQDIFYVNPSLSDREHSDSQYSHSQSSGSENYYEVIPDRRSYESINTQLALQGHAIRGLNLNAAHLKEQRNSNIPAYILEDYPPPPYQPPRGLHNIHATMPSGLHHRQSSANAVLQGGISHYASRAGTLSVPNSHMASGGRPSIHQLAASGIHPMYRQNRLVQTTQTEAAVDTHTGQKQVVNAGGNRLNGTPVHSDIIQQALNRQPLVHATSQASTVQSSPQSRTSDVPLTSDSGTQPMTSFPNGVPSSSTQTTPIQNSNFVRQLTNSGAKSNQQNIQLQTYGQSKHQSQGSGSANGNIPNGRAPQYPNSNVAKLLHDAYRIQQFETTA